MHLLEALKPETLDGTVSAAAVYPAMPSESNSQEAATWHHLVTHAALAQR